MIKDEPRERKNMVVCTLIEEQEEDGRKAGGLDCSKDSLRQNVVPKSFTKINEVEIESSSFEMFCFVAPILKK